MARLETIDPIAGVYAISYENDQFDPGNTKIGEGTTGMKYASSYMGARSRWWDMSMKQALLEQEGIDAHNRRIDQEILNLEDARANIIQGIPQRYDTIYKHNNAQEQMRREFNASSGPITTVTTGDPRGQRSQVGPRAKGAYYVRRDVQGLTQGATSANQVAGMLSAGREAGTLGKDEIAQDQAAFYAVQMNIEESANSKINAGVPAESAWREAEQEVLGEYDAATNAGDVVARYRKVQGAVDADLDRRYRSVATRTGRDELPPYLDTASRLGIDPYEEVDTITQLDREIEAKEAEKREALDLIGRTREIQLEKFGPNITQALRGVAGNTRKAQARRALERYFQQGGTLEGLREVTGYDPTAAPPAEVAPAAPPADAAVAPAGPGLTPEPGVDDREGIPVDDGIPNNTGRSGTTDDPWGILDPGQTFDEDPVGDEFKTRDPEQMIKEEGVSAISVQPDGSAMLLLNNGILLSLTPQPNGLVVMTLDEGGNQSIFNGVKAADGSIQYTFNGTITDDYRSYLQWRRSADWSPVSDEELEVLQNAGVPLTIIEELPRKVTPDYIEEGKIEQPEETGSLDGTGRGSPVVRADKGNMIRGFAQAAEILKKPKKLQRQAENASPGSPVAYARSAMDAWSSKDPSQRETLQELVQNVAEQYNGIGDTQGRQEALEYTVALYKLNADSGYHS